MEARHFSGPENAPDRTGGSQIVLWDIQSKHGFLRHQLSIMMGKKKKRALVATPRSPLKS